MQLDEVINKIIKKMDYKIYVEIGTSFGNTFNSVNCEKMICVEPRISNMDYGEIKHLRDNNYSFYKMLSDDFFNKYNETVDIVFVDGFHEYTQCLKDITSALNILNPGGIVLVHDVIPENWVEALSYNEYWNKFIKENPQYTGGWTGDVWKSILHIRSWEDVDVQTFDVKYGLSVIMKRKNQNKLHYEHSTIQRMTYKDFEEKKQEILNIKKDDEIINEIVSIERTLVF